LQDVVLIVHFTVIWWWSALCILLL